MLRAPAGVEGLQGYPHIHLGNGLAFLPQGAKQFHQRRRPLQLAGRGLNDQIQPPQHQRSSSEGFEMAQGG